MSVPHRRIVLSLLAAAIAVAVAALSSGPAMAYKTNCVKHSGGTTVCNTKKPLACKPGSPTICQDWRNRCTTHKSGAYTCDYVEKYARCRGSSGHRCRTVYTSCTTTHASSDCHATAKAYCTIAKGRHSCAFSSNACSSRGSSFRCTYSGTVHDCRTKWCKRAHQVCHSGSGMKTWCTNTVTMGAGLKPSSPSGSSGSGSGGGSGSPGKGSGDGSSSGADTGDGGDGGDGSIIGPLPGDGSDPGDDGGSGDSGSSGDGSDGAVGELFQLDQLRAQTARAQTAIRRR